MPTAEEMLLTVKGRIRLFMELNTRNGLYAFPASEAHGVITDQVELALAVRDALDNRSDYDIIIDRMGDIWTAS